MPREFNEEMVCSYYELQGYFVRMNVPYRPADDRNDSSDIDIVAVHLSEDMKMHCVQGQGLAHQTIHHGLLEVLAVTELHLRARDGCCERTYWEPGAHARSRCPANQ